MGYDAMKKAFADLKWLYENDPERLTRLLKEFRKWKKEQDAEKEEDVTSECFT